MNINPVIIAGTGRSPSTPYLFSTIRDDINRVKTSQYHTACFSETRVYRLCADPIVLFGWSS